MACVVVAIAAAGGIVGGLLAVPLVLWLAHVLR